MKAPTKQELITAAGQHAVCAFVLNELAAQNHGWVQQDNALLAGMLVNTAAENLSLQLAPSVSGGILVIINRKGLAGIRAAHRAAAFADGDRLLAHLGLEPGVENWPRITSLSATTAGIEVSKPFPAPLLLNIWGVSMEQAENARQKGEASEADRQAAKYILWRAGVALRR